MNTDKNSYIQTNKATVGVALPLRYFDTDL
jgi:hypothetical protein